MKKILTLLLIVYCFIPFPAYAMEVVDGGGAETETVSRTILNDLTVNPLKRNFESLGDIVNALVPYIFSGAGLVLFAMLITGGFTMLTAISDPKKAEAGKQTITTAIVGFLIMFLAYWLTQILEIILGITIF